jgi:hypothetical protein
MATTSSTTRLHHYRQQRFVDKTKTKTTKRMVECRHGSSCYRYKQGTCNFVHSSSSSIVPKDDVICSCSKGSLHCIELHHGDSEAIINIKSQLLKQAKELQHQKSLIQLEYDQKLRELDQKYSLLKQPLDERLNALNTSIQTNLNVDINDARSMFENRVKEIYQELKNKWFPQLLKNHLNQYVKNLSSKIKKGIETSYVQVGQVEYVDVIRSTDEQYYNQDFWEVQVRIKHKRSKDQNHVEDEKIVRCPWPKSKYPIPGWSLSATDLKAPLNKGDLVLYFAPDAPLKKDFLDIITPSPDLAHFNDNLYEPPYHHSYCKPETYRMDAMNPVVPNMMMLNQQFNKRRFDGIIAPISWYQQHPTSTNFSRAKKLLRTIEEETQLPHAIIETLILNGYYRYTPHFGEDLTSRWQIYHYRPIFKENEFSHFWKRFIIMQVLKQSVLNHELFQKDVILKQYCEDLRGLYNNYKQAEIQWRKTYGQDRIFPSLDLLSS